jgi:hypothetical protein
MSDLLQKLRERHGQWRYYDGQWVIFTSLPEQAADRIAELETQTRLMAEQIAADQQTIRRLTAEGRELEADLGVCSEQASQCLEEADRQKGRAEAAEAERDRLREATTWRPIEECGPEVGKIIGWVVYGPGRKYGEARACQRHTTARTGPGPWMAHGYAQEVTHFKPWPSDAPDVSHGS